MKKTFAIVLALLLVISFTGCGIGDLKKVTDLIPQKDPVTSTVEPTASASNVDSTETSSTETVKKDNKAEATEPASEDNSGNGELRPPSDPDTYWDRLEDEWKNAPEEGYVWTITINDDESVDAFGFASVEYMLNLSCSHVGPTMDGVYSGEMDFTYAADYGGLNELLSLPIYGGGGISGDTSGWFENEKFIMDLTDYDEERETTFVNSLNQPFTDSDGNELDEETNALVSEYLYSFMEGVGSGDELFELQNKPKYYWFDWDHHMTGGDMSQWVTISGNVYGIVPFEGYSEVDSEYSTGNGSASAHVIGGPTFAERYDEVIDAPFPYVIHVYETGDVVFELHNNTGGPVVVKFYGKIDKKPVEETQLVGD